MNFLLSSIGGERSRVPGRKRDMGKLGRCCGEGGMTRRGRKEQKRGQRSMWGWRRKERKRRVSERSTHEDRRETKIRRKRKKNGEREREGGEREGGGRKEREAITINSDRD